MTAPKTNLNVKQAVPLLMVTNLETSIDFYKKLGFAMENSWVHKAKINWCRVSHGGAALMLQEYLTDDGSFYVPKEKLGIGVIINFICEDALAIYKYIISQGIETTEPLVGNQMWVVGLHDPDGYQISFQSDTQVKEGTTYAEWVSEGLENG